MLRASKVSALKLKVSYTIPFSLSLFWYFWGTTFNFLNYFVWLRITDEGSVSEKRICSILIGKYDFKWCIHLSRSLFFYLNFISSGSKIVKRLRRRQYDPLIIETTIGLVLGPCTALCRLFLKHCTLTNKAVGTIWRALSKPPQRRQGPDLRPLWLLVGTPSAIRPELAFSRAEHSLPYSDVTIYIFAILYLSSMRYVYRFLWPLRLGWLLVCCLYKEVYLQFFLNVCPFDYTAVAVSGKVGPYTG